jgi:uncharacterized protein
MPAPFWKAKTLAEMNDEEWESLCDGCGKCCLHKIEDEDTGEIFFTRVACRQLDIATCRCKDYAHRTSLVPECLNVREQLDKLHWLPSTCAYRLLAEGRELAPWHPLVSGRAESVHRVGVSVREFAIPEPQAGPIEEHVIEWLT